MSKGVLALSLGTPRRPWESSARQQPTLSVLSRICTVQEASETPWSVAGNGSSRVLTCSVWLVKIKRGGDLACPVVSLPRTWRKWFMTTSQTLLGKYNSALHQPMFENKVSQETVWKPVLSLSLIGLTICLVNQSSCHSCLVLLVTHSGNLWRGRGGAATLAEGSEDLGFA